MHFSAALDCQFKHINRQEIIEESSNNFDLILILKQTPNTLNMKLSLTILSITGLNGTNAFNHRRSSDAGFFADGLPRLGSDLTDWNRISNGAVTAKGHFDDRQSRVPSPQSYFEKMLNSEMFDIKIQNAVEAVQRRSMEQRRRRDLIKKSGY